MTPVDMGPEMFIVPVAAFQQYVKDLLDAHRREMADLEQVTHFLALQAGALQMMIERRRLDAPATLEECKYALAEYQRVLPPKGAAS